MALPRTSRCSATDHAPSAGSAGRIGFLKLVGDFPITTYVLAYDQQRVAISLGDRNALQGRPEVTSQWPSLRATIIAHNPNVAELLPVLEDRRAPGR